MYCVIMAGGKGTRFWPRSRVALPKQLLNIVGEQTMLQETIMRILPCCSPENILIITNVHQEALVREQARNIPPENIIAEPVGRNTAPCICLAAALIRARCNDAVMAVMPADHFIQDAEGFRACLIRAAAAAKAHDVLITIGITPTAPETGYGYIQQASDTLPCFDDVVRVERFHEKPDRATAMAFLRQGNVFWNSGTFVWKASVILEELCTHLPDVYRTIAPLQHEVSAHSLPSFLSDVYPQVPAISIDYGVMEKTSRAYVIKGSFGWSDVGSWSAIYDITKKDEHGNVTRGDVVTFDASRSLVFAYSRLVAVSGINDVIVVETDDAVLVCSRDKAQDIRSIVEALERAGKRAYL
ncbi:MAG: sugar phosphate nucleotidyltransferase [Desulfobacterota bacterium]|nr:sugar phosphate nucleotidyltransferase [Thermodesulfobacteriota bacterium]